MPEIVKKDLPFLESKFFIVVLISDKKLFII